jgi:hypothetical protein
VHGDSALREWQGDAACADSELERGSARCSLGEEVDDGVDDHRVEHVGCGLVVPGGDAIVEVAIVMHASPY